MGQNTEILSDVGLENLRFAIVRQAAQDYHSSLRYLRSPIKQSKESIETTLFNKKNDKEECERFFRSSWFGLLCDLDGELILSTIRGGYYNRRLSFTEIV